LLQFLQFLQANMACKLRGKDMAKRSKSRSETDQTAAPPIGDNSSLNAADRDKLKSLVDRIEAMEGEKAGLAEDIRGIYAEAKSAGFDGAALRQIIRLRKQEPAEREARQAIVDAYLAALGGLAELPLGKVAIARDLAGLMPPV
jgi:uncharacterized protein (UPF0335 family)